MYSIQVRDNSVDLVVTLGNEEVGRKILLDLKDPENADFRKFYMEEPERFKQALVSLWADEASTCKTESQVVTKGRASRSK